MSIRNATKVGYEPIPGYTLRKRLGAGGYGEVWLADAPGGLQKAIKLIYGTVDQSHAISELRSLQRIRQVYHPFLLSLERIEVVDQHVVIITELAESSLLDRFEQCRRKGAPGIDRGALLDFLRDAADALDFLAQKHSLQHLDVKPGNLLIIADRIKVADFGLIKDLHDQNQSLVSGLTPTYSAPEIFDGRPDYRSDQYSLAIVYMEMLTGQLPFTGKTTGELARQHLTQTPDLESLPPADRPIVARALSKNPLDRYGACRMFVEQLLKTRGAALPNLLSKPSGSQGSEEGDSPSTSVDDRKTSTSPALLGMQSLQPAIDVEDLGKRWVNGRSMFVGLGGMGGRALVQLRRQANKDCDNRLDADDHAWAAIDTDSASLEAITDERLENHLPSRYALDVPLYRPSEYRNADPDLFGPLSRRWLYNIPRSLKTDGVRPLSTLTLLHHYPAVRHRLATDLGELVKQHEVDVDCEEPLRIYVIASLHGGTGSGLMAEIGFLIRRILHELAFSNYRLCAVAAAATTTNNHAANLHSAAAVATLSELTYMMDGMDEIGSIHFGDRAQAVANSKPFDWVTLVDGGLHGVRADAERASQDLARAAWLDSQSMIGAALAESRNEAASEPRGWLLAACQAPISISSNLNSAGLARWCCLRTLQQAIQYMTGPKGMASSCTHDNQNSPVGTPTVSGDFPLTAQAACDFTQRLLADLGLESPLEANVGSASAHHQIEVRQQWIQRLSEYDEVAESQLAEDIATWRSSIARIVEARIYNWKQIEQIQLTAVEGIVDFYESQSATLLSLFKTLTTDHRSPEQLLSAAIDYLKEFSEQCLKLLQSFQRDGWRFADKLRSWCDSIAAEKALNEAPDDVILSGLPPRLQLLTSRVNAVLETKLHRLATQLVSGAKGPSVTKFTTDKNADLVVSSLKLEYMLALSNDVVARVSSEMGVSLDELDGTQDELEAGISMKQLETFYPTLSQGGGKLYRFVVTPVEQQRIMQTTLKKQQLDSKTTLITSRRSLDSYVICDSVEVQLSQLVSALWRPSPITLQLAERLRTRIDIDWEPATRLLEYDPHLIPNAQVTEIVLNPVSAAPQTGTRPLPLEA